MLPLDVEENSPPFVDPSVVKFFSDCDEEGKRERERENKRRQDYLHAFEGIVAWQIKNQT